MTITVTMLQTRRGEDGSLWTAGSQHDASDSFAAILITSNLATGTLPSILSSSPMRPVYDGSGTLIGASDDRGNVLSGGGGGGSTTVVNDLTTGGTTAALSAQQGVVLKGQVDAKAPIASPTFTGTVAGVSKSMVGLGNVDNTSDTNKPVSTAQQTALDAKAAKSQTECGFSFAIDTVADQDYTIILRAPHAGTITETSSKCTSGTATATFKVGTTALGGTANAVSTSQVNQAQSSSNTFAAGDLIKVTMSANSSCLGAVFSVKYTRTLA